MMALLAVHLTLISRIKHWRRERETCLRNEREIEDGYQSQMEKTYARLKGEGNRASRLEMCGVRETGSA